MLRELLASFGVEVNGIEKVERFEGLLGNVIEKSKQWGELLLGGFVANGIKEFVENTIHAGAELNDLGERLGVSTDELQEWQYAAQMTAASAEEATMGVRFLTRNIGLAAGGQKELTEEFHKLKINIKDSHGEVRTASQILPELADAIQAAGTHAEKTAIAVKLLGRGGMGLVPMLDKGSAGLQKFKEEFEDLGGGITEQFAEQADEAEHAFTRWKYVTTGLKTLLVGSFLPILTEVVNKIAYAAGWFRKLTEHSTVLKSALAALEGIGVVLFLWEMVGVMREFSLVSALAAGEWILMAAGIFALYLIFDDLFALFTGGKSVIGELIDKMFGIGTSKQVVESVKAAWDVFWGSIKGSLPSLKEFAITLLEGFVNAIPYIIMAGRVLYDVVGGAIQFIYEGLKGIGVAMDDLKHGDFKKAWEDLATAKDAMATIGQNKGDDIIAALNMPKPQIHRASEELQKTSQEEIGAKPNRDFNGVIKVEINNQISGVSDPQEAASHAGKLTRKAVDGQQWRSAFGAVFAGGDSG